MTNMACGDYDLEQIGKNVAKVGEYIQKTQPLARPAKTVYQMDLESMFTSSSPCPKVVSRNHPDEHRMIGGTVVKNRELFKILLGTPGVPVNLDTLIPPAPGWHYMGTLYGEPMHIDETGRFQFGPNPENALEVEVEETPKCEHGYVVRDIQGENRFHCKECDQRFPRHPSMMPEKTNGLSLEDVKVILDSFHKGVITFTSAINQLGTELEEFNKAMKNAFPPEPIYEDFMSVGSNMRSPQIVGETPRRVTCYKETEDIFSNPDVTLDDFNKIATVLPDLEQIDQHEDEGNRKLIMLLHFVDGSIQRVELDEVDMAFRRAKRQMERKSYSYGRVNGRVQVDNTRKDLLDIITSVRPCDL